MLAMFGNFPTWSLEILKNGSWISPFFQLGTCQVLGVLAGYPEETPNGSWEKPRSYEIEHL